MFPLTLSSLRFDLALQLGNLDVAQSIAVSLDSEVKWKQLGELAISSGRMSVAEQCLQYGKDFSGLLLLYSAQVRIFRSARNGGGGRAGVGGKKGFLSLRSLLCTWSHLQYRQQFPHIIGAHEQRADLVPLLWSPPALFAIPHISCRCGENSNGQEGLVLVGVLLSGYL